MPDDELLNESGVPGEESSVSVEPSQEQELSPSDDSTNGVVEDSYDDPILEDIQDDLESEISEDEYGDGSDEPFDEDIPEMLPDVSDGDEFSDDGLSVSANEIDYEHIQEMINRSVSENT